MFARMYHLYNIQDKEEQLQSLQFGVIDPRLYNYLPTWVTEVDDVIIYFKINLKTFLFKLGMNLKLTV